MDSISITPSQSQHTISLSTLPFELKKRIVYWVHHLPPVHQKYNNIYKNYVDEGHHIRPRRFQTKSESLSLMDTRLLASVNRSFYEICRPYLFESFDLRGYTVDRSEFTLEEIIKTHSDHIKKISWRFKDYKSIVEQAKELMNECGIHFDPILDSQWEQSEILLRIIKHCPRLTELDIDLEPTLFIPTTKSLEIFDLTDHLDASRSSDGNQYLSIQPISQLTLLTHLSISSCPISRRFYTETFLVDIISSLSQLQSFTCSRIDASQQEPLEDQIHTDGIVCESPLGIHLASLAHLVELDLEEARCVDLSWNQLDWKSSLISLSLENCPRVSVSVLHGFTKLFQSTLTTLTSINDPRSYDGAWTLDETVEDLINDQVRFELPNLINLEISNYLPNQFLRAFEHSKKLSWILLGDFPLYRFQVFKKLFQDQLWPNLKKLEIKNQMTFLSPEEIEDLVNLCKGYGIGLEIDIIKPDYTVNVENFLYEDSNLNLAPVEGYLNGASTWSPDYEPEDMVIGPDSE